MVLTRPRFAWQSLQFDRATALGFAVACNLLVFGLLTLPLERGDVPRRYLVAEEAIVVEELRVVAPEPGARVPPPPVPPERPPAPIPQPLVQVPVEVVVPLAPVVPEDAGPIAEDGVMRSVVQAVVPVGDVAAVHVEARAAHGYAPPPPYPANALRRGLEGEVWLRVRVDADGRVLAVELERSSGQRELDRAAERQVRERWRFQPAQRDGRAVASWVRVPISFRLDR